MKRKDMSRRQEANNDRDASGRAKDSRGFDSREAEERTFETPRDPLYIPPEWIPEGYTYGWIRSDNFGEEDVGRQVDAARTGWRPVPTSRHPQLNFVGLFSNREANPYFRYKGATLCERPTKDVQKDDLAYEKLNYEKITSMPGTENFMGEASIPTRNMSETHVGRSQSFR